MSWKNRVFCLMFFVLLFGVVILSGCKRSSQTDDYINGSGSYEYNGSYEVIIEILANLDDRNSKFDIMEIKEFDNYIITLLSEDNVRWGLASFIIDEQNNKIQLWNLDVYENYDIAKEEVIHASDIEWVTAFPTGQIMYVLSGWLVNPEIEYVTLTYNNSEVDIYYFDEDKRTFMDVRFDNSKPLSILYYDSSDQLLYSAPVSSDILVMKSGDGSEVFLSEVISSVKNNVMEQSNVLSVSTTNNYEDRSIKLKIITSKISTVDINNLLEFIKDNFIICSTNDEFWKEFSSQIIIISQDSNEVYNASIIDDNVMINN